MLRATFAGFSVARGAMSASMKALDITGQNISNVYTEGYTRQRIDQVSFASGYGNYAATNYVAQVGNGVLVTGISQIRDPYLDIQYRTQMANVGMTDAKASVLEEIESVFDETMKSAIKDAFSDLESKLLDLANSTGAELDDSIVRSSMQSLVNLFHSNASSLAIKRENVTNDFEKNSIRKVNELMEDIAELNKTIKSSQVLGYPALELQDQRNQLLDELASFVPISITYHDEWVSSDEKVDSLEVSLMMANGTQQTLIDHDKFGKFDSETFSDSKFTHVTFEDIEGNLHEISSATPSYVRMNSLLSQIAGATGSARTGLIEELQKYVPDITVDGDKVQIKTEDGSQHALVDGSAWNISFDYNPADQKITLYDRVNNRAVANAALSPGAIKSVEKDRALAIDGGTFAGTLNMLNSSGVFDGDATTEKGFGYYEQAFDLLVNTFAETMNALNQPSTDGSGNPAGEGGDLFVKSDNSSSFTAANIMVNDAWIKGDVHLKSKIDPNGGTTQNDNINKMIAALNDKRDFTVNLSSGSSALFNGNFYNYYVDIESTLGIDQQSTDNLLQNHITVVNTIAQSKDQVSGVSLDEEGVNLMQYQQSYTAAARLMTTLDEALNVLINNTGVVGR